MNLNLNFEKLPTGEWACLDLDTYDGASDSGSREVGYGKTMDAAFADLLYKLLGE